MFAILGALLVAATAVHAQTEEHLRDAFEGKTVVVKIDMPATDKGIDILADARRPIDYGDYTQRLKAHGTSVKAGTSIMVTKVKVKKDLIEFQLGGGGYGTFWDDNNTSVYVPSASKTEREKNLEKELKTEKDPARRRAIQEELDKLRKERERTDALAKASAASAEVAKEGQIREKALTSGSRFNVRFRDRVPADALTPEALMKALAEYVDFGGASAPPAAQNGTHNGAKNGSHASHAAAQPRALRKGLTQAEVEAILGEPVSATPRTEGTLKVVRATYESPDGRVVADFVEGVLVRYTISSS